MEDLNLSNVLEAAKKAKKQNRALQLCIVAALIAVLVHFGAYSPASFLAVLFLGGQAEGY